MDRIPRNTAGFYPLGYHVPSEVRFWSAVEPQVRHPEPRGGPFFTAVDAYPVVS